MSYHPYLAHRARKRPRVSWLELRLLDRDLAEAGVHIPWSACVVPDESTRKFILRTMSDALNAA